MHTEPWELVVKVKQLHSSYFLNKRVLEVGSLDINGSVRGFFKNCHYVGLDLGVGKGVDVICPVHEYVDELFDVVISTEMLEHDVHWEKSLKAMHDFIKPGGLFIFTCAGPTRQEHGTKRTTPGDAPFTTDYYRNITFDNFKLIIDVNEYSSYELKYERNQADLLFFGIKL